MIKAILLDIDGTLYPYEPCDAAGAEAMRRAYSEIFREEVSSAEFSTRLAEAKKAVKSRTAGTAACHNRLLYSQTLCERAGRLSAEAVLRLYDAYWDAFLERMEPFEGAAEFLAFCREKGLKTGFCTDLTAHIQARKLLRLGFGDAADAMVTSEEAGAEKPSPEPFRLLLEKLGAEPENAVMIGDDYKKDVLGARALGIRPLLFGAAEGDCDRAPDFAAVGKKIGEWIG